MNYEQTLHSSRTIRLRMAHVRFYYLHRYINRGRTRHVSAPQIPHQPKCTLVHMHKSRFPPRLVPQVHIIYYINSRSGRVHPPMGENRPGFTTARKLRIENGRKKFRSRVGAKGIFLRSQNSNAALNKAFETRALECVLLLV